MKKVKKAVAVGLIGCTIFASFSAFGVSNELKATLTSFKLFLNGNKVDKQIAVINGSSYLPVRAISEALNLDVDWNGSTETINLKSKESADATVAKEALDALQRKNDELTKVNSDLLKENGDIKSKLTELQNKLNQYTGTVTTEGDGALAPVTFYQNNGKNYTGNWSSTEQFKVKGKVYDKDASGISFAGNTSRGYVHLKYVNSGKRTMTLYTAKDDKSVDENVYYIIGTTVSGTNKILSGSEYTVMPQDNGLNKIVIDISGYSAIYYLAVSKLNSGTVSVTPNTSSNAYNVGGTPVSSRTVETYQVLIGPYVK